MPIVGLGHARLLANLLPPRHVRFYSSSRPIQEHDVLYLRQSGHRSPKWHLTPPLRAEASISLSYGAKIKASDLIGRNLLDSIQDSRGHKVKLYEPSLASYIVGSKRIATPIYPHDASTIVSFLDLNLSRPGEEDDAESEPFEIFECGTGMGSLTIHVARALHAANPPIPPPLRDALTMSTLKTADEGTKPSNLELDLEPSAQSAIEEYRRSRRAILHTLDHKHAHASNAFRLIQEFRRAMYLPTIDFHVGSVNDYISSRLKQTGGKPFLSRAILDLPAAEDHAALIIEALHTNGLLVVFMPSISQVGEFQAWCTETRQPINVERVIELPNTTVSEGPQDGSGGRAWDVKSVSTRESGSGKEAKVVQVMRPKVGDRVAGGGFVAVLRRFPPWQDEATDETMKDESSKSDLREGAAKAESQSIFTRLWQSVSKLIGGGRSS